MKILSTAVAALAVLAAPLAAAAQTTAANAAAAPSALASTPKVVASGDLIQTAKTSGQFTTLLKALDATNLTAVLKNYPNLTLFAPTDQAFAALPPGELDRLMADKTALQKLLTHHIINARIDSAKIKGAKGPVTTVATDKVELDGTGETLKADNADIVQPDVLASNGVLHVVDKVLQPGAVSGAAAPASATVGASASAPPATGATGGN